MNSCLKAEVFWVDQVINLGFLNPITSTEVKVACRTSVHDIFTILRTVFFLFFILQIDMSFRWVGYDEVW